MSADFRCLGRGMRPGGTWNLYPFRLISTVWVEISDKLVWGSLPFFRDFRCLGRDIRPVALGISTFSVDSHCLGRDIRTVALGFSTFFS